MTEEMLTKEEFVSICSECGLEAVTKEGSDGKFYVTCYISSPVLRDGRNPFCYWEDDGHSSFYDALWKETRTDKYTVNDTYLGDSERFIYNKAQLHEVCLNVMHALTRLENNPDYRPEMIDLNQGRYERTMTKEEFASICSDCGLEVETTECGPGMIDVVAYISSPVLRDGRTSFGWWNNYVLSGGSVFQGFFDALWRETSTGKYTINGTDLGDRHTFVDSKEHLREVCLNVLHALKHMESDQDYRPKMIDLNWGKYERKENQL